MNSPVPVPDGQPRSVRLNWIPAALLAAVMPLPGQNAPSQTVPASGNTNIAREAADPTASLMAFRLKDEYVNSFYGIRGKANAFVFQPIIPFQVWGRPNLLRVTMTHDISGPDGRGLDNIAIFDLVVFEQKWGRWGVGPVVQFFPAERSGIGELLGGRFANIIPFFPRVGLDIDTTVAGPAAGFVVRTGKWNLGLFNQNYFGGHTRFSTVQPIVAYDFGAGWTVEAGEAQWGMDWKRRQLVSIPIGIQLGKVVSIAGQPIRFFVNPEFNARNITGAPHWLIRSGFAILSPAGPR